MNHEQLISLGFRQQRDGSWSKPPKPVPALRNKRPVAIVESNLGDAALGASQVKGKDSSRFLVRVTSVRKRLLDTDNLCEKYHVDCCRYSGIIPADSPDKTQIEVRQRKAGKKEEETVIVEVFNL